MQQITEQVEAMMSPAVRDERKIEEAPSRDPYDQKKQ